MSSHRDWFQAYSLLKTPRKIWLGDNTFILAHGVGHIPIHMCADHKWNRAILQDVLYVPDLHGNLLSVSALTQHGAQVHFAPKSCEIRDKNSILTCVGHLEDNLYILNARTYVWDSAQVDEPKADEDFFSAGHVTALQLRMHSQMATVDVKLRHRYL